jgi:hypothetical protein
VLTLPIADALSLPSMGSDGLPGYHSRRSSRADSEISSGADSTAGGLVCEPSSFGVCADPAGELCFLPLTMSCKLRRAKRFVASLRGLAGMVKAGSTHRTTWQQRRVLCYAAGAVHLVTPAIPDKLARLKQRLPSRLTADVAAAAVARCSSDVAGAAGLQAGSGPDR